MKKIRIIDLIILMYHKEMPYKIMYEGEEYVYNKEFEEYVCCDHDLTPLFSKYNWYGLSILDDAVEILELKKIKKIEKINGRSSFTKNQKRIIKKINEIIDKVNNEGDKE